MCGVKSKVYHRAVTICAMAWVVGCFTCLPAASGVPASVPPVTTINSFQLSEKVDYSGVEFNVSELQADLPVEGWDVDRIGINFTALRQEREFLAVEDHMSSTYDTVYKSLKGRAVQFKVSKPAMIHAVELYIGLVGTTFSPVFVQINGYNIATNAPNSTRFGNPALINVSTTTGWHVQHFPEPVYLPAGNYFICINGSGYQPSDNSYIWWYYNATNRYFKLRRTWTSSPRLPS